MPDLTKYKAKLCQTACGFLIRRQKILLIKHKKLQIWLAPGGHVEPNELPHHTAERELLEETGIKVTALTAYRQLTGTNSQYLPLPFAINLHWIDRSIFKRRLQSSNPNLRRKTSTWPLGCEQHWVMAYLVKPISDVTFKQNREETDAIRWFTLSEIKNLDTTPDIKREISLAFKLHNPGL